MSPTLADLPAPPPGRTGWPWTVETPPSPPTRPDGSPWPRISIVTPSYNQGAFIEETIRSVLLQGYPDLEYAIIDGGSTDESVEIIKKYEPWLAYWVSEKDRGAQHAINKGLERSTGSVVTWLNSDDIYRERVLEEVAIEFGRNPHADVVSGVTRMVSATQPQRFVGPSPLRTFEDFCLSSNWTNQRTIIQPEAFFTARIYAAAGPIREDLDLCFDYLFWVSAADKGAKFCSVDRHWVDFRVHPAQKSTSFSDNRQETASAIFIYCRDKEDIDQELFKRISVDLFGLLNDLINFERNRANFERQSVNAYRESTSYKLGRLITRLRFW